MSRLAFAFALVCMLSCAASRGGWDVGALAERTPALERYVGHRLGDLVPFPVLAGRRVRLVACRFAGLGPVNVRSVPGATLGERAVWVGLATRAVSRRVPGLELRWAESGGESGAGSGAAAGVFREDALLDAPVIWLEAVADGAGGKRRGWRALGETQSECDVATGEDGAVRGRLLSAGIRMGTWTTDNMGRPRGVSDAEWLGAMMHELGHAVGFVGHVVSGDSLMVREESTLRRWGQRVIHGAWSETSSTESRPESEFEPTLAALYTISAGEVLGERNLADESVAELRRLRALQGARASQGVALVQTVAKAGDRDARIEWRYSDGSRFGVWFRGWAEGLRAGGVIEAELDLRTRRALIAAGL